MTTVSGTVSGVVDAFLEHHLRFNPVDATFMGLPGHDADLPPADAEAPGRERAELDGIAAALASAVPATAGDMADARLLRIILGHLRLNARDRPRFRDPTWYTGEAAFGLISLLLPGAVAPTAEALDARLAAIPRFLDEGRAHLTGQSAGQSAGQLAGQLARQGAFSGWVARARTEMAAIRRLLAGRLQLHPLWREGMAARLPGVLAALAAFDGAVAGMPDADPRCGRDHLDQVMRGVHLLPVGPEEALDMAQAAMARVRTDLVTEADRIDPGRSWQEQLADLAAIVPEPGRVADTYRAWHEAAMDGASGLLTPASEYGLAFRPFPDWAQGVHGDLYFLAYRCPPGARAGTGSVYWVGPPGQSVAQIKSTHAVHHGSVGHHTQNARARGAASKLARIVNQGVARGIAFQCGGTMGEGWSCYVQELMAEVPGFYSPAEGLLVRANELRHAACLVADIRFHTREWDMARMRRFYREEAGFPAGRVDFETVKNSLFPGNRLMYWLGVEQIKTARARWTGTARAFHDGLIARGHVPLTMAIDDLFASG